MSKKWSENLIKILDGMMDSMRGAIINNAEEYSSFRNTDIVDEQGLEIAIYKSIETLNEANHAAILKKMGPVHGVSLIETLQFKAQKDVGEILMGDLKAQRKDMSPEQNKIIDKVEELQKGLESGKDIGEGLKELFDDMLGPDNPNNPFNNEEGI